MPLSRRQFLARSGAAGAGIAFAGSMDALLAPGSALAATGPGYGPLVPDPRGLLDLPRGFRYRVVQREGERMLSGGLAPGSNDAMGTFRATDGDDLVVCNHEQGEEADYPARAAADYTYDAGVAGGTTTLRIRPDGSLQEHYVSLAGTIRNCAGGVTPWGTWLTCEETEDITEQRHGYVFEVSPNDRRKNVSPTPLRAMGRFSHEAVAVDPRTGWVYLTEDADEPNGLFYRFKPERPLGGHGSLRAGGVLEAMHVPGVPDLSAVSEPGTFLTGVRWRPVPDVDAVSESIRVQFADGQVTRSRKLEGCWFGKGAVYFVASYARREDGSAKEHNGQVWRYDPGSNHLRLALNFGLKEGFDGPDNISTTPNGGILLAEDGDGEQHIVGFDPKTAKAFYFAKNRIDIRDPDAGEGEPPEFSEFAGPVFSPNGSTLYFNVQEPGITYAVTGPFQRGPL